MHGSIRQLVCPACGDVTAMSPATHTMLRVQTAIPCPACHRGVLRCRVMLYDDAEGASASRAFLPARPAACNPLCLGSSLRWQTLPCRHSPRAQAANSSCYAANQICSKTFACFQLLASELSTNTIAMMFPFGLHVGKIEVDVLKHVT